MFDFGGCFDTDFHFALCAVNFALLQFHTLHFICSPKTYTERGRFSL